MQYEIAGTSRRCARTGRELLPGERHMVVLYNRDERLVREDICQVAWQGPPEQAFAWWQSVVPEAGATTKVVIDDGLLYDCFIRLEGEKEEQKLNFRYVLALWLLRKRKLKFEEIKKDEQGEWLMLREARIKKIHQVLDPHLNEEAIAQTQQEVEQMLRAA